MAELNHEAFMRRAIELSAKGGLVEKTGGCFGAVIVVAGIMWQSSAQWDPRASK